MHQFMYDRAMEYTTAGSSCLNLQINHLSIVLSANRGKTTALIRFDANPAFVAFFVWPKPDACLLMIFLHSLQYDIAHFFV